MSAWVIALGLAAGYLMNKNTAIASRLDNSVSEFQGASKPATDGVTSQEVRNAYKRTDHVTYGDFNEELPKTEMNSVVAAQKRAADAVEAYDSAAVVQIEGVMLQYGDQTGV